MPNVIYNGNGNTGGQPPTDNTTYAANASFTVAGPGNLSLGSGPFFYWNTKADGTGTIFRPGANTFPNQTSNLTLFAVWGVTTGLTNGGVTTHFNFFYDPSLGGAGGVEPARINELLTLAADGKPVIENDLVWLQAQFAGVDMTKAKPFPIPVQVTAVKEGGYDAHWGWPLVMDAGTNAATLLRSMFISEVSETFMSAQDKGWGYSNGVGDEESCGEALSLFLTVQFQLSQALGTTWLMNGTPSVWLNTSLPATNPDSTEFDATGKWGGPSTGTHYGSRQDYVANVKPWAGNGPATGCCMAFLYYLFHQLQFTSIPQIIADAPGVDSSNDVIGGSCLNGVYTKLTNDPGDPFPLFASLLAAVYPPDLVASIPGPNVDDPWPIGLLSFWVDQNTFGRDQAQDIIDNNNGLVSSAFYLVLEGFSQNAYNALNITIPTPTGAFAQLTAQGITVSPTPATPGGPTPPAPIPEFEDSTNLTAPQRIRFSFDITFTNLDAFPQTGGQPVLKELDATAQFGGKPLAGASASALFELLAGANPYFTNTDPTDQGDVFYLSQDLRVFPITAGSSPLPGAPKFTSDPYGSIQSLIGFLNGNSTYTSFPGTTDPLNALPGQSGYETGDSSVYTLDQQGNQNYNFAVARVRLRGSAGDQALNTRVFFRLWVAQSFDTDFQPTTTYKSTLGASGGPDAGYPVFPLASATGLTDPSGQTLQTVPFFATGAAGTHDYDGTITNSNIQNITIPSTSDTVCAYFGCYLDVFNSNNNPTYGGTHHCVVAQIAYDGAPIPTTTSSGTTPSPANWDQLAQRNLQITTSENPQSPATHVVPQAFDTRPSPPLVSPPGQPVSLPDEIMIDWGNTPAGSTASIYWPQVSAADVIALANTSYSAHLLSAVDANTLQCSVTKGVTYIPIPPATGVNFAGLLTLDLPTTITNGQQFNILLRRVATRQAAPPPPPIQIQAKRRSRPATKPAPESATATAAMQQTWRQVTGAFQVRIPVTTKQVMLAPEEDTLAVLKWRLEQTSPVYRWYPVLQRYVSLVAARVDGLGGNSADIPPSLSGYPGKGRHPIPKPFDEHATGKVDAILYDRFGDFDGFLLRTLAGAERRFHGREPRIEELVRIAWEERWLITVEESRHDPGWPSAIILRHPASDLHR